MNINDFKHTAKIKQLELNTVTNKEGKELSIMSHFKNGVLVIISKELVEDIKKNINTQITWHKEVDFSSFKQYTAYKILRAF